MHGTETPENRLMGVKIIAPYSLYPSLDYATHANNLLSENTYCWLPMPLAVLQIAVWGKRESDRAAGSAHGTASLGRRQGGGVEDSSGLWSRRLK